MTPLRIGGVGLIVRDLERVAGFYRDVVGLAEVGRDDRTVRLGAGGDAFLTLRHRPEALPRDPAAAGLYHTAFLVPSRADLGRWLAHAGAVGLRLDGAADHLVSEAVYLHDPEGNGIEICADRDPAVWRWEGPHVVMANDRLDMIGLRGLATSPWQGAPPGTVIGHVHLQVGNVDEAAAFYTSVLGMDVTRRWREAVFLSTGGYHHHLAGNTWHSAGAGKRDMRRAGLEEVVLAASGPEVVEAIGRRGGAGGVDGRLQDPWGTHIRVEPPAA